MYQITIFYRSAGMADEAMHQTDRVTRAEARAVVTAWSSQGGVKSFEIVDPDGEVVDYGDGPRLRWT